MDDLVGDIHGHAAALESLLTKLGYVERNSVYRHESRKLIFVGDFIDRGPKISRVLQIAHRMVEKKPPLPSLETMRSMRWRIKLQLQPRQTASYDHTTPKHPISIRRRWSNLRVTSYRNILDGFDRFRFGLNSTDSELSTLAGTANGFQNYAMNGNPKAILMIRLSNVCVVEMETSSMQLTLNARERKRIFHREKA